MDRDSNHRECTRDPIFLLQVGTRQWTRLPSGLADDGESMWVDDEADLDDWVRPFLDDDGSVSTTGEFWKCAEDTVNDDGWPLVFTEWRTEAVFLTRDEAESWVKRREYNYPIWRVYCVPCNGRLAEILQNHPEESTVS